MRNRKKMIISFMLCLLIAIPGNCVFGATTGKNVKTVTVYKWQKIYENYDK